MIRRRMIWRLLASALLAATVVAATMTLQSPSSYDLLAGNRTAPRRAWPGWIDAWKARLGEIILPLLDRGDTEYAAGFAEEAFSEIEIGASEKRVLKELGNPLLKKTFPDGTIVWYYSRHGPHSKSYFIRGLEFNRDARVDRIFREYYLD